MMSNLFKMNNQLLLTALFLLTIAMGCNQPPPVGEMQFPEGTVQHVVHANEIQWNPCPPHLPDGCEVAVLEGDPKSPDLFSVRFRVSKGFLMPPHTHPRDERVTVIEGKVAVAFGEDGTRENAKVFGPGDYYVNSRGAVHTVWADTTSILQITGIGPWVVDFIDE